MTKDNDKIFQLIVQMLDSHDDDATMKYMIAMVLQRNDGMFNAQMKWCMRHDAIAMMLTQ